MTNAELIETLRYCFDKRKMVAGVPLHVWCDRAADALEAAEKRIAELEDEIKNLEKAYITELTQAHINVQRSAKIYREWYEAVGRKKECMKNDSE